MSGEWVLVDTGAQTSVLKPLPEDVIDPSLKLETVDGSEMSCYGKKKFSIRLGRKEFHIDAMVSKTTDTILGMDFLKKYKIELRWNEFGDMFLYDPKSNISTICQFVKIPKGQLSTLTVSSISTVRRVPDQIHQDASASSRAFLLPLEDTPPKTDSFAQFFSVSSLATPPTPPKPVPLPYQKLLKEFPEILTPNFKDIKHKIEHAIPTGDSRPIRSKVRPILPGSPKAKAGFEAWDQMVKLGIVKKVTAEEAQTAWSFPLHLQTKPDLTERPCGDFRRLNDLTLQEAYQLPNINTFSSHIKQSKVFSKLDISKAFHFIPIRKEDQLKACVNTPWGLYKFQRMAFGLKNAPSSFQAFAEEVLDGVQHIYI